LSLVLDHPSNDEFEITVIGTGGGYGETILIHLSQREWIVVDSCKDPISKKILGLDYLKQIGVKVDTEVKMIVCTHWDDDHIKGISDIFEECKAAIFCISAVRDRPKFLQLVSLDYEKLDKIGSVSSTKELMACLKIIQQRDIPMRSAMQDRNLYSTQLDNEHVQVHSLSPSDRSMELYDSEISRLISEYGSPAKKLIQSPNQKSVVLYLKLGRHRAILGADLEVTGSQLTGWECILQSSQSIDQSSSYIKISHHGSENGYHSDIWTELLEKNPLATLTPWNKNHGLPQQKMVELYKGHTDKLYITSNITSTSSKKRDSDIEKAMARHGVKTREIRYYEGIIRSRIKLDQSAWTTALSGYAKQL